MTWCTIVLGDLDEDSVQHHQEQKKKIEKMKERMRSLEL